MVVCVGLDVVKQSDWADFGSEDEEPCQSKKVIGNNIESMQRRDNRIPAQDAEIVNLKAKLVTEIQSNKMREGILWAQACEEKCKK